MQVAPVPVFANAGASPSPKTTFFFFADGTFARGIHGIIVAVRACGVDVGGWGLGKLGVEGVEYTDRGRTSAAIFLPFSGFLGVGRTNRISSRKG